MDKVLLMEQRLSVQILLQSGRCEKNYIHPHLMKYIGNLRIWAKRSDVQAIKRKKTREGKREKAFFQSMLFYEGSGGRICESTSGI